MIKQPLLAHFRRAGLPATAVLLGLSCASCRLPSRETWAQVQQRGLIPVLMTPNPEPTAPSVMAQAQSPAHSAPTPADSPVFHAPAVKQPEIAQVPFANPVPGHSGFVFSPYAGGRKMIDVRNYAAGAEVRCPYTMKAFHVPDFTAIAKAQEPAPRPRPSRSVAEVASTASVSDASVIPSSDRAPNLTPEPAAAPKLPAPASTDIPYGTRVAGRPGFVYSPFAAKNQLVDVAGIAPGVEVNCPYSNKLFRVPEPLPEELAPSSSPTVPAAAEPAPAAPAATPGEPSPAATSAAEESVPMATWADKAKHLVQSPFGAAGQLVDVSGRAAGSTMACPFTNKNFVIPAP